MNQELSQEEVQRLFAELKKIPENQKCIDCSAKKPTWTSVNLGLFLCMDCAGKHRQYTVKYSFVKSITLDSWTKKQILFMQNGGNNIAIQQLQKMGVNIQNIDYKSNQVTKYRNDLENKQLKQLKKQIQIKPQQEIQQQIQPQIKQFKVQFNKNQNIQNKGKAKKIDNIDFDKITLQDEQEIYEIKEVTQQIQQNPINTQNKVQQQYQIKSISSKHFQNQDINQNEKMNYQNINANAQSISSSQYYGEPENKNNNYYQQQIQSVIHQAGDILGGLGQKTSSYINNIAQNWKK